MLLFTVEPEAQHDRPSSLGGKTGQVCSLEDFGYGDGLSLPLLLRPRLQWSALWTNSPSAALLLQILPERVVAAPQLLPQPLPVRLHHCVAQVDLEPIQNLSQPAADRLRPLRAELRERPIVAAV